MKIENGQYIKLLFRYGNLTIEGVVESWEKDNYIIRSLTDESLMIIQSPQEDIMVIKVMPEIEPDNQNEKDSENQSNIKVDPCGPSRINDTSPKLDKINPSVILDALGAEEMTDLELRTKKLAELHLLKIKAEREMVANKLKDHTIGETRKVEYGLPGIFKKPSTK